jgi:hypothetical protein
VIHNVSACALACHSDEGTASPQAGRGDAAYFRSSSNGTAYVMCTAPSLPISTAALSGRYRVYLTLNGQKESLFSEGDEAHFLTYKSLGCAGGLFATTYREACHPCAPGTAESRILDTGTTGYSSNYSDMEHTLCRACPLGQYQPLPGALSCSSCPIGENEPIEVRHALNAGHHEGARGVKNSKTNAQMHGCCAHALAGVTTARVASPALCA